METVEAKFKRLRDSIGELGSVLVAYSGGVDSAFLLSVCASVLGAERVLAVTADSPTYPRSEKEGASALARDIGVRHEIVATDEMRDPRFTGNPPERCYFCKAHLFQKLGSIAETEGFLHVVYGANSDDGGDFRPGMRAARDWGVRAPLMEAGITKEEVRVLSKRIGLPTWNKPATACLASRFPYRSTITEEALARVELAEDFLRREMGFTQVRVRHHDAVARLEVEPARLAELVAEGARVRVISRLKAIGYSYVALDLEGFRSGSMNETLHRRDGKRESESSPVCSL